MSAYPGFVGPSSLLQTPYANCERLINLYYEPRDVQSSLPALYGTPGFASFTSTLTYGGDIGGRALFGMNDRVFAVMGGGVFGVVSTGVMTRYGTVAQNSQLAQIITNGIGGNQAGIASGTNFYSFNLATNVLGATLIAGDAVQIGMIDGYGVAFADGTIRLSNLNDFTTWDPTQFASRSAAPDNWRAMCVNAPDIWLIGERSGDVWYDAGAFPFPLAPRPGVTFPYGIGANFSIAVVGDSVIWLAQTKDGIGPLVRARGYTPQPIGSNAFNTALAGYQRTASVSDAEAVVTQFNGHPIYVLRFPSANAAWGYDIRTNAMFELGQWNSAMNRYDVWAPRVAVSAFNRILTGDSTSGTLASMNDTLGTELNGAPIRRLRIPPALVVAERGRGFVDRFELGIQTGLGTATGTGSAPVVLMRVSHDYGQTWGNQRSRSIGPMGQTQRDVVWNQCGSARKSWVPEIVITEVTPIRIVSAHIIGRGFEPAQEQAA